MIPRFFGTLILMFVCLLGLSSEATASQDRPLPPTSAVTYVGVARSDITPIQWDTAALMWLGGFGHRQNHLAWGMDPGNELFVNVLWIQDQQGPKLLITADLLGFPRELTSEIRKGLSEEFGLNDDQIMLNASHTHSGPALPQQLHPYITYGLSAAEEVWLYKYGQWLRGVIRETARRSLDNLEPVEISFAQQPINYSYNRYGRFKRGVFSDLSVLVFHQVGTRKPKVIAVSYAAHPIMMGYHDQTGRDPYMKYHPDYPGVIVRQLEARYPGSIVVFVSGAAGDVDPAWPSDNRFGPFAGFGVGPCGAYGVALSFEAARLIETALVPVQGPITTHYSEVLLPLDLPDLGQLRLDYECVLRNTHPLTFRYRHAQVMIAKTDAGQLPTTIPYPIAVWSFSGQNPLVLIGLAGEPVQGYAGLFKQTLGIGRRIWVAGYTNELPGYLPSQEMLLEPSYEAGWDQTIVACSPPPRPRKQPTFAGGYMVPYGWPAPLRGSQYGTWGAEEIVVATIRRIVLGKVQ